jgi:hypothetical protein
MGRVGDWMTAPLDRPVTREMVLAWLSGSVALGTLIACMFYLLAQGRVI